MRSKNVVDVLTYSTPTPIRLGSETPSSPAMLVSVSILRISPFSAR